MKKINIINYNTLLFFIIRASFIGISSSTILKTSKQDSLLSIIIGTIIGIIPLLLYYKINDKYKDKKINEIIIIVFGKYIGTIINIIISLYIMLYASILLWNLTSFISSQYLYNTPEILVGITFTIAIIYSLFGNINSIVRATTILFYLFFIFYIISIIGITNQLNLSNLLPLYENTNLTILEGSYKFIGLNILPIFIIDIIPHNIVNSKNIFKNSFITYLISILTLLIVCFYTISIYSINFVNLIEYPEFHVLKRVNILGFDGRAENILIIQWIFDIFIFLILSFYYISNNISKKRIKIFNILIPIISLIISLFLFKNNTIFSIFINDYLVLLNYIIFFIIPLITYIIIKLKGIIFTL